MFLLSSVFQVFGRSNGTSFGRIRIIKAGKQQNLTIGTIKKIAKALNVWIEDLIK